MADTERYYIQSKFEPSKFLKKLSFSTFTPLAYTHCYAYIPNISDYPLSFTSVNSIQDCILNTLFTEAGSTVNTVYEINYNVIQEASNLKIVKLPKYNSFSANAYLQECENTQLNNILEYIKKAAFNWISYKIFNSRIANYYSTNTNISSRVLGAYNNNVNQFIVDVDPEGTDVRVFNSVNDSLSKLGVTYYADVNERLITFDDLDSLNFARISAENAKSWKITRFEEFYSLEKQIAYSQTINLGYISNEIWS